MGIDNEVIEIFKAAPGTVITAYIFTVCIIAGIFRWAYGATLKRKDSTIENKESIITLLREQLKMAKEDYEARKAAEEVRPGIAARELEALVLFAGNPSVRRAFLELTDSQPTLLRWDPREELDASAMKRLTLGEVMEEFPAFRILLDKGYILGVAFDDESTFVITPSEDAMAVRAFYDGLPANLKDALRAKVRERLLMGGRQQD